MFKSFCIYLYENETLYKTLYKIWDGKKKKNIFREKLGNMQTKYRAIATLNTRNSSVAKVLNKKKKKKFSINIFLFL